MYARTSRSVMLMVPLLLAAGATSGLADTLSGRVYEGRTAVEPPPAGDAQPLTGVTVSLYGSNDENDDGTGGGRLPIQTTTTNSDGWYSLTVRGAYDFYNIIQTNLSGYVDSEPSPAAMSVGGTVKSSNWIQYGYEDIFVTPATMTGNKFWDKKEGGTPPENRPPVAQDDSASTSQDTAVTIDVLANDTDPDGDALHVNSATNPSHGTTVNHGSNVTYTPDPGFTGTDTFDYTAGDGRGGTDTATVTVTVERGTEPPPGTGTLDGYKRDAETGAGLANWRIYIDLNANGQWDGGEPTDLTDGNGYYRIPDVEPGTYRVCEEMQAGWENDEPCVEGVTVVAGVTTTQDFHNRRTQPPDDQTYIFNVCFNIEIILPDGTAHKLSVSGPATMRASVGPNGEATDTNGNGRDDVDAELLDLQLVGLDPVLGSVALTVNPGASSTGRLEERANNTAGILDIPPFTASGTADSFFDVWLQIDVSSYGLTLFSSQAKRLADVIDHVPPALAAYAESPPTTVDLVDQNNQVTGVRLGPMTSCRAGYGSDYGDAPLPYPEASHLLGGPYLGPFGDAPDAEPGMQRDAQAAGDDNDANGDDENGLLSINLVKTPGVWSTWELKGYFAGSSDVGFGLWIDFNGDGDWDDPNELRAQFGFCSFGSGPQDWFHASGAFQLPAAAKVGTTYARLRVYDDCNATIAPSGAGGPGEVEDYVVQIKADGPGVPPGGIVHGYKWHDLNGNGLWDILNPVEPPLAGWTIWLDTNNSGQQDAGDMTTQTDAQGHFRFTGVPAGTYTLGEQLQAGWTQTTPGGAGTYVITVHPGQASFPQMFGNRRSGGSTSDGRICGSKWNDLDGNGTMDAGEPWLSGWTVYLDLNQNGRRDPGEPSQLTDATGGFEFTGLALGSYTVAEEMQAGWQQTWPGGTGTHTVNIQSGGAQPACVMFGNTRHEAPPPDTLKKLDWGDAPDPTYPTLRSSNGAYHVVVPGFCLGQAIDDEADGQPAADALGDDFSGIDDEDGVVFLTPMMPGGTAELEITVSAAGLVDGWIDFDGDGSWSQPGDQILKSRAVASGTHVLSVAIPPSARLNLATFARFRLSRTGGLGPEGPAQAGEVEDYHVLIGPEGPGVSGGGERAHRKWSQPPLEIDPNVEKPPVFCGWNEPARSTQSAGQRRQWRMDADDFRCLGPIPVTRVRWWGGYQGWDRPEPPEAQPQAWHLGFWANQVEGLEADQLYPERLVWSVEVPNERVSREPVGLGEFPQQLAEMCFVYEVRLEPSEWFPQDEFPTNAGVFWLSVTAIYPPDAEPVYQWGWTSRPHVWGRGAVMPAIMGEWPTHEERLFPGRITPITSSVLCGQSRPYDLCFELLTDEPWVKWDQPFTGLRDWPYYEDLESQGISIRQQETIGREVADDWACDGPAPVIAAAWWGSYIGRGDEPCRCDTQGEPRPDYFLLRIRTDAAAGAPGAVVWEYRAFDYDEVSIGCDRHPEGEPNEPVFRYTVRLPEDNWFRPERAGRTYWLSVTAMYVDPLPMITHSWGWTSHRHVSGSGAFFIDYRVEPPPAWRPLLGREDQPLDTAFTLFTVPEP